MCLKYLDQKIVKEVYVQHEDINSTSFKSKINIKFKYHDDLK